MTDKRITLSVRLTPEQYAALIARCEACEPPTTPTTALRWLLLRWLDAGKV